MRSRFELLPEAIQHCHRWLANLVDRCELGFREAFLDSLAANRHCLTAPCAFIARRLSKRALLGDSLPEVPDASGGPPAARVRRELLLLLLRSVFGVLL